MHYAQLLQSGQSLLLLLGGGGAERRELAGQAHQHRVQHGITKGRAVYLGDVGDMGGQRPLVQSTGIPPVQQDGTAIVRQTAQNAAEQGTFPRAVGAQHRQKLSLPGRERDVPQRRMATAICIGNLLYSQLHRRSSLFTMR